MHRNGLVAFSSDPPPHPTPTVIWTHGSSKCYKGSLYSCLFVYLFVYLFVCVCVFAAGRRKGWRRPGGGCGIPTQRYVTYGRVCVCVGTVLSEITVTLRYFSLTVCAI